jgi:amino acid transporter
VGTGFLVALLQAGWTFTGYDASAHASEETQDAAMNAPRGLLTSVTASAIAGYAMLLVLTLAVGDLATTTAAANPFIFVLEQALGQAGTALVWLAVGAMWSCGLASITSNSRMLYAFACDGGPPFSRHLSRVSARHRSPHIHVWVSAAMALVVSLSAEMYTVMVALSVVALYASDGLPIAVGLWARRRGWPRTGPWTLGRFGPWVNAAAIAWLAFMVALMSLPPNGLAGVTLLATITTLAVAWVGGVRRLFGGPKAPL